jgi:hypothetical protein
VKDDVTFSLWPDLTRLNGFDPRRRHLVNRSVALINNCGKARGWRAFFAPQMSSIWVSFGKMPMTSVSHLISALSHSKGFVDWIWTRWAFGVFGRNHGIQVKVLVASRLIPIHDVS